MKYFFTLLSVVLFFQYSHAQDRSANIWCFGNNAELDFNSGAPVSVGGDAMATNEGCASIANRTTGQLLFYSDGTNVWNRNNQIMPSNTTPLGGNASSTQSAIIVPYPGSTTKYYLFTVDFQAGALDATYNPYGNSGVAYTIIDMTLNGGLGDISQQPIDLVTPTCEKITAAKMANGNGYWMITHLWNSDAFYAYPITTAGVGAPVASHIGTYLSGDADAYIPNIETLGYMKVSPDGSKIAVANTYNNSTVEVFNFNNATGVISGDVLYDASLYIYDGYDYYNFNDIYLGVYGLSFSPDSKLLYVSISEGDPSYDFNQLGNSIYQYDLTATNVLASRNKIGTTGSPFALQLAPDKKIYLANYGSGSLDRINNPNIYGMGCNFQLGATPILYGTTQFGLPDFIENLFGSAVGSLTYSNCTGDTTVTFIDTTLSGNFTYFWNFGDPASGLADTSTKATPTHNFSSSGTYNVTLIIHVGNVSITVNKTVVVHNTVPVIQVSSGVTICGGNSTQLLASSSTTGLNYTWSPPTGLSCTTCRNPTASPSSTTTYTVQATDSFGCSTSGSVTVTVVPPVQAVAGPDTTICLGSSVTLYASGGASYSWSPANAFTNANLQNETITPTATADYNVIIASGNNTCPSDTVTVHVIVTQAVTVTTTNDTVCLEGTANLTATPSITGGTYSWSPGGGNTSTISVSPGTTTTYTVTYSTLSCGNVTATAEAVITSPPTVTTTGASICTGKSAQISATPSIGGGTYSWSPGGETTSTITVSPENTTTYTVTYIISGCGGVTATATVNVTPVPLVTANGTTLCHGDTGQITAIPEPSGGTYLWAPGGATTSTITVTPATATDYTVTYSLNGCSASDTVTVNVNPQPVIQLTKTNASCSQHNGKIVASGSGATAPYSYFWSNLSSEVSTPVDSNLAAGTYTVSVYDERECSATASATIIQLSAVTATDTITPFPCAQPPYANVVLKAAGGQSPYTYMVIGTDTNSTGKFDSLSAATYEYIVTDTAGCSVSGSFIVPEGYPKDSFDIAGDSTSCFGLSDGSVVITPVLTPNSPYTYSLNGGTAQSETIFDSLPSGDYQVIVYNHLGCTDTLSTSIYQPVPVSVSVSPDTAYISNHDTSDAFITNATGFITPVYLWTPSMGLSCTNCPDPTATLYESSVMAPSVFYVTVSDSLNSSCKAYDSVIVIIKGAFKMPDAFTPNGDGKNDLFGPVIYSYLTIKEFHIYNRWGQIIHNSTDLWDGKYKGEEQPVGTYVYYIVVEHPDELNPSITKTEKKEGSVVLLR